MQIPLENRRDEDARRAAMTYVGEAFALAALDGIEVDAFAEAALCAAMCELVAVHGEDSAALVAERLAGRAAAGEFSGSRRQKRISSRAFDRPGTGPIHSGGRSLAFSCERRPRTR